MVDSWILTTGPGSDACGESGGLYLLYAMLCGWVQRGRSKWTNEHRVFVMAGCWRSSFQCWNTAPLRSTLIRSRSRLWASGRFPTRCVFVLAHILLSTFGNFCRSREMMKIMLAGTSVWGTMACLSLSADFLGRGTSSARR